jgi:hypothetical protein
LGFIIDTSEGAEEIVDFQISEKIIHEQERLEEITCWYFI